MGTYGGSNSPLCHANPPSSPPNNGQCGTANGGSYVNAAAVNAAGLCSYGTPTPGTVAGGAPWSWQCVGSG